MSGLAFFQTHGFAAGGFKAVQDAFMDNFADRRELGGACCVYQRGTPVVDIWGGVRNKQTDEPWEGDTMVIVHSATKGLAAMTLAIAHSRGWLDYDERVCAYWPEFGQQGKERITVRQLLAHQAGLFAQPRLVRIAGRWRINGLRRSGRRHRLRIRDKPDGNESDRRSA